MLASLGRFDDFADYAINAEDLSLPRGGDTGGDSVATSSRRAAQRGKSKGLGLAARPVFQLAMDKLRAAGLQPRYVELRGAVRPLPWATLPAAVSPAGGHVPESRLPRKVMQVENMVSVGLELCRAALSARPPAAPGSATATATATAGTGASRLAVVEFCAGSGYVALPLGCMAPEVSVCLVDMKAPSLCIGERRIAGSGLGGRASCRLMRIEDWAEPFQLGVALHACGAATDVSLQK
jgi:hypothetical protein